MSAFVVVSLALAVVALGVVVVVVRYLLQTVRKLRNAVAGVSQQIVPLTKELTAELAVTNVEVAELGAAVRRISEDRAVRARRRQGLRPRRKAQGRGRLGSSRLRNRR